MFTSINEENIFVCVCVCVGVCVRVWEGGGGSYFTRTDQERLQKTLIENWTKQDMY